MSAAAAAAAPTRGSSWLELWVPITAVAHALAATCLLYALSVANPQWKAALGRALACVRVWKSKGGGLGAGLGAAHQPSLQLQSSAFCSLDAQGMHGALKAGDYAPLCTYSMTVWMTAHCAPAAHVLHAPKLCMLLRPDVFISVCSSIRCIPRRPKGGGCHPCGTCPSPRPSSR